MQVESKNRRGVFYETTDTSCSCPAFMFRASKSGGRCKHMEEYFPRTEISLPENIKEIFRKGLPISQSLPLSDDMINQLLSSQTIILVGHTYKLLE